jgi:RNA polymerase-binding transcription factor DksA
MYAVSTEADIERTRLFDAIEGDLAGVSMAMERLDGGTYFTCATCEKPLADEALAQNPTLSLCPSCQNA